MTVAGTPYVDAPTRFHDLDGERIAYRRVGQGDPLVMLHRFRASMDDWDPALIDALARDREVVLFDSVGVGESSGTTPTRVEAAADIAAAVTRGLGFATADFLGWSLGGMVGQALALRHPEIVRKLVLAGTTPPAGTPEVITSSPEWGGVAAKPTITADDLLYLFFPADPKGVAAGRASLQRTSVRRSAVEIKTTQATMGAQYQAIVSFYQDEGAIFPALKTIGAPTLVVNGDADGAFPAIDSIVLAREIPGATLILYPEAGHGFLFQLPERFAADVHTFLTVSA
jgi:pimeloyl-ACP methyl ester carboxylesterase